MNKLWCKKNDSNICQKSSNSGMNELEKDVKAEDDKNGQLHEKHGEKKEWTDA